MNKRRTFLKQALVAGTAIVAFPVNALENFYKKELIKITILHTNDVHSHIEPFPANDPKFGGLGGTSRRAALIRKIRAEEKNVLLLDAGDVFQGTPYFNFFGGELEFKLMSEMQYDACTIGNHDFDNGIEGLVKMLPHANFPFICSNYNFSNTEMDKKTIPYKTFILEGIKIGVFGLGVELDGLVPKKLYQETHYLDPVKQAAYHAHLLKKEMNCDLVICLSHLGFRYQNNKISDVELAKRSKNIDLIIGGHTHTLLNEPVLYKNSDEKEVIVAQVGWAGIRLGKIDFYFEPKSKRKFVEGTSLVINSTFSKA
jgi:5'-nucleotidase